MLCGGTHAMIKTEKENWKKKKKEKIVKRNKSEKTEKRKKREKGKKKVYVIPNNKACCPLVTL